MNARFAIVLGLLLMGGSLATLLVAETAAAIAIGGIGCSIGLALGLLAVLSDRWLRIDAQLDFFLPAETAQELVPVRVGNDADGDESTALVG